MSTTPEGAVKKAINKLLDKHGCYRFMPVNSQFSKKTVDYLVCAYGVFIAIEAKAPGKRPTALQQITLDQVASAGGGWFIVDGPEALAELELAIDECARKRQTQSPSGAA